MTRVPQFLRIIPVGLLLLLLLLLFGCDDAQAPTAPAREGPLAALVVTGFQLAQVSTGELHACGVTSGGQAFCWGDGQVGQLGNGTFGIEAAPVAVAGGLTFTQISAGGSHTCGVAKGGAAYCWGIDGNGQLGNGAAGSTNEPTLVAGGFTFIQVSAGDLHTCGVAKGGQVLCWGRNDNGELGNGTSGFGTEQPAPVPVAGALLFAQVSAGRDHTCGVSKAGEVLCWGSNILGQLGNGTDGGAADVPRPLAGGLTFSQLSAGATYNCGVAKGGQAYCWGDGTSGQLGTGTGSTNVPTAVTGGLTFSQVSAALFHTCGVAKSGYAYCWGDGGSGQLGNGESGGGAIEPAPVPVVGGLTFTQVSARDSYTCGVSKANGAYCWGSDVSGRLGNGLATGSTDAPSPVSSPAN